MFSTTRGAGAIAQTVIARFLAAGLNLITGIICARVLGSGGRGEMSAMLVWPALLASLLTLGLPAAIRYWIRREPERRSEFFTVAVFGATIASIIAIAIGVAFIPLWLHNYSAGVIHSAQFLMVFAPEIILGLVTVAMLETLGEFGTANVARYATVVLTLIALAILALAHVMTPFTGAIAYTGAPVVIAFWTAWKLRAHFQMRFFDPRPAMRVLASYGFRAYGIDLLNSVASQVDQVLVIALLSAPDVGIYVVALNASRVINILHTAVVSVVFPTAAGRDKKDVLGMVERSARISTGIALAFAAALIIVLPIILPLFYGGAFREAIPVAQLLSAEAVLSGLVAVLSQAFMALGRPGVITILQALGLLMVLPLMILLLPHFGLMGAAYALLISTLFRLALMAGAFPFILHVPIPRMIPIGDDFALMLSALGRRKAEAMPPVTLPAPVQSERTTWAIITGEYPPQPGGVSDYTWLVAHRLAAAGDNVHVFAPATDEPELPSALYVHRLSRGFSTVGRRELYAALDALPKPRRALLQFVLQAFGKRALNLPFVWSLRRMRGFPLWIMFHEFALDDNPAESSVRRAHAFFTRVLARMAAKCADLAFVSTPAWTPLVAAAAPGLPIHWLPVPSNLVTQNDPAETAAIAARYRSPEGGPIVGHFGSYRMRDSLCFLEETIPAIARVSTDRRILLLGRGSDAFAAQLSAKDPELASRIIGVGKLESAALANHLAACDILLQPYSDGATTRRGSLLAGLALGVPVLTTLGPLSEDLWRDSGAAFFAPPNDVRVTLELLESALADPALRWTVGQNGRKLYQSRFDVAHTVDGLRKY